MDWLGLGMARGWARGWAHGWARALLVGALACGGCGDDDVATDAGTDAGTDASTSDGGLDSGLDAGSDGGADDAGEDAGEPTDSGVDASFDSGLMSCAIATIPFTGPIPGMTLGETDDYDPPDGDGCPFATASGPDRVYALVATEGAGTYEVEADPVDPTFDLMLYVLASCDAIECVAGTRLNGPGDAETVTMELEAGAIVYVVVDTMVESSPGAFVLTGRKL